MASIAGSHPDVNKAMKTAHHGRPKHKMSPAADAREDAVDKGRDEAKEYN
jgi:hypothetical protein